MQPPAGPDDHNNGIQPCVDETACPGGRVLVKNLEPGAAKEAWVGVGVDAGVDADADADADGNTWLDVKPPGHEVDDADEPCAGSCLGLVRHEGGGGEIIPPPFVTYPTDDDDDDDNNIGGTPPPIGLRVGFFPVLYVLLPALWRESWSFKLAFSTDNRTLSASHCSLDVARGPGTGWAKPTSTQTRVGVWYDRLIPVLVHDRAA